MQCLADLLASRIVLLDGAMGTMIQKYELTEADFRAERFAAHPRPLKGCNDLLVLTQPQKILAIHQSYLAAGADILETNSFNATSISLADYGLEAYAYEINVQAARLAKAAIANFKGSGPRWVAGSLGPTNKSASISPDIADPGARNITFRELVAAYRQQVRGLIAGGVDILLLETAFDTLNLKAALFAVEEEFSASALRLPVMCSVTIVDQSGRTLSGQTLEACWVSLESFNPWSIGLNCALGAEPMRPYLTELSALAPSRYLSCAPNAGLPNAFGGYDETPESMAAILEEFAAAGLLNIVGGCCGTTPEHLAAISQVVRKYPPRRLQAASKQTATYLSGLEPLKISPESNFILIGERTNVAGSRKFLRLIREERLEEAVQVAREQVLSGANILDVNMDEALLDAPALMRRFLNLLLSEPEIARLPLMIDSSDFAVIEAGLQCIQGKSIVNSLSLKGGEAEFIRQARLVKRYGAAVLVMAFDEQGQAVSSERKVAILERAYKLLTSDAVGFEPTEIIFDPNILTIATGIAEHDTYALAFLDACTELKKRCPGAKISGGISNLSFAFRGNEELRRAINAVFLYHALKAGLDMGIVNAEYLMNYEDIPQDLRLVIEEVIFNRRPEAADLLVEQALKWRTPDREGEVSAATVPPWRTDTLEARLSYALVHGLTTYLEADIEEALRVYPTALEIIEGPLLTGMNVVGELFGAGKMFLPQVVKSARVMQKAVAFLLPHLQGGAERPETRQKKVLLATVKGDVHDIGKNIVGVVLGCNSCQVIDLGVMVEAHQIIETAIAEHVDIIGLSGLITPSLHEMEHVAQEMERRHLQIPLLIGGATTSSKHTAIKIAPHYSGLTMHVKDASRAAKVVNQLMNLTERALVQDEVQREQQAQRDNFAALQKTPLLPYSTARAQAPKLKFTAETLYLPPPELRNRLQFLSDIPLETIIPYIDWTPFFHVWELKGKYPSILTSGESSAVAQELFEQAQEMLAHLCAQKLLRAQALYGFLAANSCEDDIIVYQDEQREREYLRFFTLRQQLPTPLGNEQVCYALADFIAPRASSVADYLGVFAVTAGLGASTLVQQYRADNDDYKAILIESLADRLAEALASKLHHEVRCACNLETPATFAVDTASGLETLLREKHPGIRPAIGYPACPDHSEKATLFKLLQKEQHIDIQLTENYAMLPIASVSGFYFNHPQARYFAVGKIGQDQLAAYAARKHISITEAERWLSAVLR